MVSLQAAVIAVLHEKLADAHRSARALGAADQRSELAQAVAREAAEEAHRRVAAAVGAAREGLATRKDDEQAQAAAAAAVAAAVAAEQAEAGLGTVRRAAEQALMEASEAREAAGVADGMKDAAEASAVASERRADELHSTLEVPPSHA